MFDKLLDLLVAHRPGRDLARLLLYRFTSLRDPVDRALAREVGLAPHAY